MFSNVDIDILDEDFQLILHHTQRLWNSVKGKTIFVTGGTGFFGIWFQMSFVYINRKQDLQANMIVLSRDKQSFLLKHPFLANYKEISYIEGDIATFDFPDTNIDYIIHAATEASAHLNIHSPLIMFNTIANGTKRVLDLAVNKRVNSFLFISSGAVYGNQPFNISHLSEEYLGAPDLLRATSVYGEAKRMAEVLCTVYHAQYQLNVKIARCFAFVGPFLPLHSHFAIGNFINDLLHKKHIEIKGDGTSSRSYLYVADLMIWLWTILFEGKGNTAYNVGSDQPISIQELANKVINIGDDDTGLSVIKLKESLLISNRYIPSIQKAKNELGLQVYTDLDCAIKKTYNFYRTVK
jgi:dTDP-glucose 4,6-dehydratase